MKPSLAVARPDPARSGDAARDSSRTAVAVVTYQRPHELSTLLPALLEQADDERAAGQHVDVIVVDNDPAGSARTVVDQVADDRIRYLLEPVPGIAAARNAALDNLGDARYVVFIDDDERPEPQWLPRLRQAQDATGCAAVSGPVLSVIEHDIDPWITAGQYFQRGRTTTGSELRQAATNNLRLDTTRIGPLRFDERFGLSGGSDTLFTRQLTAMGERIVWCDEAVVSEGVPTERTTRDWVVRRTFRLGNTDTRASLAMAESAGSRTYQRGRALLRGALRIVLGRAAQLAGVVTRSLLLQSHGRRLSARGEGIAAGALGHVHVEYARDDDNTAPSETRSS